MTLEEIAREFWADLTYGYWREQKEWRKEFADVIIKEKSIITQNTSTHTKELA